LQKNPTAIAVVAAALINDSGQVLMQRRRADRMHGGLWEFPGGKVEPQETDPEALQREIEEELGLTLDRAAMVYLAEAADAGSGIVIRLYSCRNWRGEAAALDADALAWCDPGDLAGLAMPPLDVPLAAAVKELLEAAK
jgi:8-oxo-dGTP diphosphatase